MGNQVSSKILGVGDIILKTNTGCRLVLKDVRHVPDMRQNLISAGKLDDAGLINTFGEGKWKLTRGSLILAKGRKEGTLYVMNETICREEAKFAPAKSRLRFYHWN
jgi:hypothetical protein